VIYKFTTVQFWFTHAGVWVGLPLFVLLWIFLEVVIASPRPGSFVQVFSATRTWAAVVLFLGIGLLPFFIHHVVRAIFKPSNARIAQERLAMGVHDLVVGAAPSLTKGGVRSVVANPAAGDLPPGTPRPAQVSSGFAFAEASGVDRIGVYSGEVREEKTSTTGAGRADVSEHLYKSTLQTTLIEDVEIIEI
jgi:hypothetical protein